MDKSNVSYKKYLRNTQKKTNESPLPIPQPHPEKPPPNVPIPGEASSGEVSVFICKICGKHYDSKEELELHMKTDHKSSKK